MHYGELLGSALIDDETIGFVVNRQGKRRKVDAEPGALFADRRLVVVINAKTSGVLKWIAAALQDSGQAVILGAPCTAPAMTVGTVEVNSETTVSMPMHLLLRANGTRLTLRADEKSRFEMLGTQQQLFDVNPAAINRFQGVLYPDKPFPISKDGQNLTGTRITLSSRSRVYDLKALLESIEQEDRKDARPSTE